MNTSICSDLITEIIDFKVKHLKCWIYKLVGEDDYYMANFNCSLTNINLHTRNIETAKNRIKMVISTYLDNKTHNCNDINQEIIDKINNCRS
jgi:hypothetical protein